MDLDQKAGPDTGERDGAIQESPIGLPPLERRRQLNIVSAVAQISLLAQAMGGVPAGRRDPQTGQSEGSQCQDCRQLGRKKALDKQKQKDRLHRRSSASGVTHRTSFRYPLHIRKGEKKKSANWANSQLRGSKCAKQARCCRSVLHRSNGDRQPLQREDTVPLQLSCRQSDKPGKWLSGGLPSWKRRWQLFAHQHRGWKDNNVSEGHRKPQCCRDLYR